MGETANWDEFVSPETGKTLTDTRIQFGKSFDPIIDKMHSKAEGMDLVDIAMASRGGGLSHEDGKNQEQKISGFTREPDAATGAKSQLTSDNGRLSGVANINYTKGSKTVKVSMTINKNNIEEVKRQ